MFVRKSPIFSVTPSAITRNGRGRGWASVRTLFEAINENELFPVSFRVNTSVQFSSLHSTSIHRFKPSSVRTIFDHHNLQSSRPPPSCLGARLLQIFIAKKSSRKQKRNTWGIHSERVIYFVIDIDIEVDGIRKLKKTTTQFFLKCRQIDKCKK